MLLSSQQVAVSQGTLQWHNEHADNFDHPSTASKLSIPDHTLDTLCEHYGFLDPGCTSGAEFEFQISWNNVLKFLGRKDASIELKLHASISHFVQYMVSSQNPPLLLWDLSSNIALALVDNASPKLQVTQVVDLGVHYILSAKRASGNDVSWQLTLDDPTTVLECLCQKRNTVHVIAEYLFLSSRPFSTHIH